jgi:hypothetical protein
MYCYLLVEIVHLVTYGTWYLFPFNDIIHTQGILNLRKYQCRYPSPRKAALRPACVAVTSTRLVLYLCLFPAVKSSTYINLIKIICYYTKIK